MSREKGFPEIGKRLVSIRGDLDQRSFSRRVNVSQQAISNYERGNLPASWAFLRRMLQDFKINVNWLLTGEGQREYRVSTPYASLADNRHSGWARDLLQQPAFRDGDRMELLLTVYFLCLETEPADAKARLMSDFQCLVDAARAEFDAGAAPRAAREPVHAVLDALARDDRRAAVEALIRAGDSLEAAERRKVFPEARRLYLAALTLARAQGWTDQELDALRKVGRSYRKEGRWDEADRLFQEAIGTFRDETDESGAPARSLDVAAVAPEVVVMRARTLLGAGHVARERGDLPAARQRYTAALAWAMLSGEPALRGEAYHDLACLAYREGDLQKAADFLASGRAFADQGADADLVGRFRLAEALIMRARGNSDVSQAILEKLLEDGREHSLHIFAFATANLAEVYLEGGKLDAAERLLAKTAASAEAHGNPRDLALRKLLHAKLEAAKGEEEAASAGLRDCLRYATEHGLRETAEEAAHLIEARTRSASVSSRAG